MNFQELTDKLQDNSTKTIVKWEGFDPESIGREFDGKINEPKITVFKVLEGGKK